MRFAYFVFILFLICLTVPLMLGIAAAIALTSGLPILYRQLRAGLGGEPFMLYKFRTMVPGAEQQKAKYRPLNIAGGPAFKIPDDPRYTKIGRFLSHTGLDELPQLFNVLRGDMQLIGPRPLPLDEAKQLKPWQQARHAVKSGIISPWILNGYHANSFDDWMRSDIAYIGKKSLPFDFRITLRTVKFLASLLVREVRRAMA